MEYLIMSKSENEKQRITFNLTKGIIEKIKNCAYWTPGLTMAALVEEAVKEKINRIEKKRGEPFPQRTGKLVSGRPMK